MFTRALVAAEPLLASSLLLPAFGLVVPLGEPQNGVVSLTNNRKYPVSKTEAAYLRAASVVFCEEKVAEALAARFRPKPEKEKKKEAEGSQPIPRSWPLWEPFLEVVSLCCKRETHKFSTNSC